jgi:hypothetical protein
MDDNLKQTSILQIPVLWIRDIMVPVWIQIRLRILLFSSVADKMLAKNLLITILFEDKLHQFS